MPTSLTEADRVVLDEMLGDIFAANSPTAISEAVRRLMAMLVRLDPLLAVETPPGERPFTDGPVSPPPAG